MKSDVALQIPPDIEKRALERFDDLVKRGALKFDDVEPEVVEDHGLKLEFRISSILKTKPVLKADDPGRKTAGGPFVNPKPEEVVAEIGLSHRILMNIYCVLRPMLVIPTREYALQTDDLDNGDIGVAWGLLQNFSTPSLVIYNCGVNAGSSQGHKHTQLFPLPKHDLWPSRAESRTDITTTIPDVPFKHFVIRLNEEIGSDDVMEAYNRILNAMKEFQAASNSDCPDYNVTLTKGWIAVIPRRTEGPSGPYGSNAAGMLGLLHVPDISDKEDWKRLGYSKYLEKLGHPLSYD